MPYLGSSRPSPSPLGSLASSHKIMACVATWSFGLQAVLRAQASIEDGKNCVDVLESAINGIS